MSVIEFFELRLSEIINESFWSFLRVDCWKPSVQCLFYCMSVSSFMQTNRAFCVSNILKSVISYKVSMKRQLSLDMLSSLMCTMIFSFVGACIETGLSALVELQFTPIFSTLPWPLLHFQCPEKNMSLWTLTPPWSTSTLHQEAKHMPEQLTPALPSI